MKQGESIEWSAAKRWNPFNSYKLLAQVYRWDKIQRGRPIPQPVLVTVDPINRCNLKCTWCNSAKVLEDREKKISAKTLNAIADFLPQWQGAPDWAKGVEAVCIAGGGEPLLHKHCGAFIERLAANGVESGVVTNGLNIDDHLQALTNCTWLGVSVDAARAETFNKLKAPGSNKDLIGRVHDNMADLIDYARKNGGRLAMDRSGYGVSYKYLLYEENAGEVLEAVKIAKEIGCRNFHLRPAGAPWDKLDSSFAFSAEATAQFREQIAAARELEDDNFGVYGITHKFDEQLNKANTFARCYAVFMTGVFMPPVADEIDEDAFTFGLCCDRRGDPRLELVVDAVDVNQVAERWGSDDHWKIFSGIKVQQQCPRCTYQPHNQIYEHVILNDSMTFRFI